MAAFNGGEPALVMNDVDGVALQCQGWREKVRGEPFGRRESAQSCSSMMADGGGARVGTREEVGSPVVGAGEAGA
jgi:hypothetical protein